MIGQLRPCSRRIFFIIGALLLLAALPQSAAALPGSGVTLLVSKSTAGELGDGSAHAPAISADGRFVAYLSYASNLVPGDTNSLLDVFLYDRYARQTRRVSVATDGSQADGEPSRPSISADGRYVAYSSDATNLVAGDTNAVSDVFVHDLETGETSLVSVSSDGVLGKGNSFTRRPALSADGRFVVFYSYASNLVVGDTNACADIFLRDRKSGITIRISRGSYGVEGNGDSVYPTISADGRFIAYYSFADNLVPGDTNGFSDVFLYDRQTAKTTRVSVASDGGQGNGDSDLPALSADGGSIAFYSLASNLVADDSNQAGDVFVHDRLTGETSRVSVASDGSQGNGLSDVPSLSVDGRYVAFYSYASNLVPDDSNGFSDVFRHDRQTGETIRVSLANDGAQGNHDAQCSAITADGQVVAFYSYANNLVPGDDNNQPDVFLHDLRLASGDRVYLPFLAGGGE